MHAAETAVAHHEHVVSGTRRRDDSLDEHREVVERLGFVAERRECRLQIPAELVAAFVRAVTEDQVGTGETGRL